MSGSQTTTEGKTNYTATVASETDLTSPVTVTGDGCTVTFAGNNFETKHLRRIRRNSVGSLQDATTGPGKLTEYITEAANKSVQRWDGRQASTNSSIYLDLGQYCQFGCQVIKAVKDTAIPWTPYGHGAAVVQQKHLVVTLGNCLAYSTSGIGLARTTTSGRVQGGVGITLTVTVAQVAGSATNVSVCHYAAGDVSGKFADAYGDKKNTEKRIGIARSIVSS